MSLGLEVKVDSHFSCHKKDRICILSKGFTQPPTLCPHSRGSHCQGQHRGKATAKSCPAPSLSNSCVGKELFLLDLPMLLLPFLQPRLQDKTTSREVVHRGRAGAGAGPKPSPFSSWRHPGFPARSECPGGIHHCWGTMWHTPNLHTHSSGRTMDSGEMCAIQSTSDPDQTLSALCPSPGLVPSPVTGAVKDNFGNICRMILRVLA